MKLKQFSFEITIEGMEDPVVIAVEHNLPEQFGGSILNAAESWLIRTTCYTTQSFCEYVNDKTPEFICRPIKVNNQ